MTRIQPCMKDWNDVLVHRAEIPNRNYFKSIVLKEPSKPETVKIIRIVNICFLGTHCILASFWSSHNSPSI